MSLHNRWVGGRLQFFDGTNTSIGDKGVDFGDVTSAGLLHGGGTAALPLTYTAADPKFQSYYVKNSAATGTARGLYMRLYLSGGAGGEAGRFYTTVSSNTTADTVNGAHVSLSFGASAGNVSGLGTASRNTLEVPDRTLNGNVAAVMAEVYATGTSSLTQAATSALYRAELSGDATGLAAIEDVINLIQVVGGTNASGNMVSAAGNEPTWTSATHKIRCKINGTTMYLVAVLA